ncbi:MAG TPA: phosphotransferase, partial [bacterium]|nr:phosphotransferase [bacterium]
MNAPAHLPSWPDLPACHARLIHEKDGRGLFRIETHRGTLALKRYPPALTGADRHRINTVLTHLEIADFSGRPGYFTISPGIYFGCFMDHPALLRPWCHRGKMPRNPAAYAELGHRIAELHSLTHPTTVPVVSAIVPATSAIVPAAPAADSPAARAEMLRLARNLPDSFPYESLLKSIPPLEHTPQCLIHHDVGPHNTLISDTGSLV